MRCSDQRGIYRNLLLRLAWLYLGRLTPIELNFATPKAVEQIMARHQLTLRF